MRGFGRQLTSAQRAGLHAVFVAVGGGGLIAGIAAYVKALHPDVKIIGVEPSGAPACHRIMQIKMSCARTCQVGSDCVTMQ